MNRLYFHHQTLMAARQILREQTQSERGSHQARPPKQLTAKARACCWLLLLLRLLRCAKQSTGLTRLSALLVLLLLVLLAKAPEAGTSRAKHGQVDGKRC